MKIAVFHELPYGGARRAVMEFSNNFKKENIVDLYYIDEKKEIKIDRNFSKIYFFKFTPRKWTGGNWKVKLYKDTIELIKIYILHKKIAKEIDSLSYDFVFVHGSKYTQAPFLLRFIKTKSAYYCQEPLRIAYEELFDIPKGLRMERKLYEKLNRKNRKVIDRSNALKANLIIANSKYTQRNIKSAYKINCEISYMGVNIKNFYPMKVKKIYDLLFIGSKDPIDGYEKLIEAIKLMKNKPRVRFILREKEWISDDSVLRKIYSQSMFLICLAYNEPFGLVPLEAQACGVPTVAIREGGYIETIIESKNGFFVKDNLEEISQVLNKKILNKRQYKNLSKYSSENIKSNWTWEIRSNMLLNLIIKKLDLS